MSDGKTCPECGAELGEDAPQGLCPKCLMAKAMEDSGEEHPQTALPRAASQEFGGATQNVSPADTPTIPSDPNQTAPSQVDLGSEDGDVLAAPEPSGKYSLQGLFGKGGMGRVLLVHDEHLGRDVALKELLPDLNTDAASSPAKHSREMSARFLREAKITGQLEHPSITPVHELGRREDGTLYYTMKFVKGRTLSSAIREAGNMGERLRLLPHFVDLCNAVAYAHSRGVIHRDIKPSNVMIGDFGETVIIDWGLAKVKGAKIDDDKTDPLAETIINLKADSGRTLDDAAKTQYGQALGTPVYMPPEQAAGDLDHVDERSDIYSLGAVLFEIITGLPPFDGISVEHILRQVLAGEPRKVTEFAPKADAKLVELVEKAMAKSPENRYQAAKDFADDVENWKPRLPKSGFRKLAERLVVGGTAFVIIFVIVANLYTSRRLERAIEDFTASGHTLDVDEYLERFNVEVGSGEYGGSAVKNTAAVLFRFQDLYKDAFGMTYSVGDQGGATNIEQYGSLAPLQEHMRPINAGDPASEEVQAKIRRIVMMHSELRDELFELAKLPPMRLSDEFLFNGVDDEGLWDNTELSYTSWRNYLNLLKASAYCDLVDGDPDSSVLTIINAIRISTHFLNSAETITQLVGAGMASSALEFLQAHPSLMADASPATLENLVESLRAYHPGEELRKAWSYDAIVIQRTIGTLKSGDISEFIEFWKGLPRNRIPVAYVYGSLPFRWLANWDQIEFLRFHKACIELGNRPFNEIEQTARATGSRLVTRSFFGRWFYLTSASDAATPIFRSMAESTTIRNLAAVSALAAVERSRTGKWPGDINDFGDVNITEFGIEPLAGTPVVYDITGDTLTVTISPEAQATFPAQQYRGVYTWQLGSE